MRSPQTTPVSLANVADHEFGVNFYCNDRECNHSVWRSKSEMQAAAEKYPSLSIREYEARMVCSVCGKRGAYGMLSSPRLENPYSAQCWS